MKHDIVLAACTGLLCTGLLATGCSTSHKVEVAPVEVKPIHITIDVNVKVDKELDDFFSDIDETAAEQQEETNAQQ